MLNPLRAMQFRGGTSKGVYLLREDLEPYGDDLDAVLSALMGGAPRQIDGLGGNATTTSKVAIVSPSAEADIDVDYLFAQVNPETGRLRTGRSPTTATRPSPASPAAPPPCR